MRKVIAWVWFTSGGSRPGTIGVVITNSQPMNEERAYIGICNSEWHTEHESVIEIANYGAQFDLIAAKTLVEVGGFKRELIIPGL